MDAAGHMTNDPNAVIAPLIRPHADAYGYMNLDSAATLQNLQLGLGLWANYSNDPVTIERNGNRVAPTSAARCTTWNGSITARAAGSASAVAVR